MSFFILKNKNTIFYSVILLIACLINLCYGSVDINLKNLLVNFFNEKFLTSENIISLEIINVRMIEILQAIFAGSLLSLSGVILHKLLRNPLADPFILGISAGGTTFPLFLS